jgi:hypothetical protein
MDRLDRWAFWPAWTIATLISLGCEQRALRRIKRWHARG